MRKFLFLAITLLIVTACSSGPSVTPVPSPVPSPVSSPVATLVPTPNPNPAVYCYGVSVVFRRFVSSDELLSLQESNPTVAALVVDGYLQKDLRGFETAESLVDAMQQAQEKAGAELVFQGVRLGYHKVATSYQYDGPCDEPEEYGLDTGTGRTGH